MAPIKLPSDDIDQNRPNSLSKIFPTAKLTIVPVTVLTNHYYTKVRISTKPLILKLNVIVELSTYYLN